MCNLAGYCNVKSVFSRRVKFAISVAFVINHIVNLTTCALLCVKTGLSL